MGILLIFIFKIKIIIFLDFLLSVQFQGYGEDTFSVNSLFIHECDEKERIREEINAKIASDHPNATIPDPSVYEVTGVDAFVFEEDNIFAEDDFDEDMLSFEFDLSVINSRNDLCSCPVRCDICIRCNPLVTSCQEKRSGSEQESQPCTTRQCNRTFF